MAGGTGAGPSFDPNRIARLRGQTTPTGGSGQRVWARAAILIAGFVVLLYGIEGVDTLAAHRLDQAGIEPRDADGLGGILWAPLLHGGWPHLVSNTVPVLVLGFFVLLSGIGRGLAATAIIWLVAGIGTWSIGPEYSVHIGASSLIFGWLTYLISRGWFARNLGQILLGLVVFAIYGSALWGVLPGQPGISWQGHLFGALGGLLAGWVLSGDARRSRRTDQSGIIAQPR
ncbi:rhomboid family intramembrane serine protease [Nocardia goodfellowii]|uniref:Membrane associated rhomboid family serine protease n=1 Tax=Nocardia goodfellowii TaxID=882446 RepID=A0ABS4QSG6_9NOCA|nr:rhomboid family intramembrane serine protease [Nocardia goodfellowii]MBP2194488.1 membrane associated rhomboid family serine protease [Nocardia goodfellowii]